MRFSEQIHWSDGLFLQPHHLQRLQRQMLETQSAERRLAFPHPWGLIDFEIDTEALAARRVVVRRLSAVMPEGTGVSIPGNATLASLTIASPSAEDSPELLVYLALPNWSEHEANYAESAEEERLFTVREALVRDENTGKNEVSLTMRRFNASLTVKPESFSDAALLPVARLRWISSASAEPKLSLDPQFMPPFLTISKDCPLLGTVNEFLFELRGRRDRILTNIDETGFAIDTLSGTKLHQVLQLGALNRFEARLAGELLPDMMTPWALYLELRTLLADLCATQPLSRMDAVPAYRHADALPAIRELIRRIRMLMMVEGAATYVRAAFVPDEAGRLRAPLPVEVLRSSDACYLALQTSRTDTRAIVEAVEGRDNFRLIDPDSARTRIRGVRMTEMRYPPRYLPVLARAVWFRLDLAGSEYVWRGIADAECAVLDYAKELFPDLEAALYFTMLSYAPSKDPS